MKRFLLPLLAALALPTAIEAKDEILFLECSKIYLNKPFLLRYQINLTKNTVDRTSQGDNFSHIEQFLPERVSITNRLITLKPLYADHTTARINRETGVLTHQYPSDSKNSRYNKQLTPYKCYKKKPNNLF